MSMRKLKQRKSTVDNAKSRRSTSRCLSNCRELVKLSGLFFFFFFQAEDGIRDLTVTGVQTCALPICVAGVVMQADGFEGYRGYYKQEVPYLNKAPVMSRREPVRPTRSRPAGSRIQIGRASCRERV